MRRKSGENACRFGRDLRAAGAGCTQFPLFCRGDHRSPVFCRGAGRATNGRPYGLCGFLQTGRGRRSLASPVGKLSRQRLMRDCAKQNSTPCCAGCHKSLIRRRSAAPSPKGKAKAPPLRRSSPASYCGTWRAARAGKRARAAAACRRNTSSSRSRSALQSPRAADRCRPAAPWPPRCAHG